MDTFKKITKCGKTIYCYGVQKTQQIASTFDPEKLTFGQFKPAAISHGVCIEPLSGEPPELPGNEFQNNSVCLFFTHTEDIDMFIERLKKCRERLLQKQAVADELEYRKKYCGKIINLSDISKYKQEKEKSNRRFWTLNKWCPAHSAIQESNA